MLADNWFSRRIRFIFIILFLGTFSSAQHMFYHLLPQRPTDPFIWVGTAGDGNWNNALNWSTYFVPEYNDIAYFKGSACTGAECNATIPSSITLAGIDIDSDYAGTITQSTGATITIGESGWIQANGTFTGGDSNITINGVFTLNGGDFTATSAQMLVTSGFDLTAGAFHHNNGLLRFDNNNILPINSIAQVNLAGNVELYNLQYSGNHSSSGYYRIQINSGSFDVQNQFQIGKTGGATYFRVHASHGTIYLKGNLIVGPSAEGYGLSTPTSLIFNGTGDQTYESTSSDGWAPHLIIDKPSGTVTPTAGTTNLLAQQFTLTGGSFTAPPGTFIAAGNFTVQPGTTYTDNGGSLNFSNLNFGGSHQVFTITLPYSLTTNHLTFGGGTSGSVWKTTWSFAGADPTLYATGDLSISNTNGGTGAISVDGGNIYVAGNFTAGKRIGAGTATITFNGTTDQTYIRTGSGTDNIAGDIIVNKNSGTVFAASDMTFNNAGQNFTIEKGIVDLVGFNLTVGDTLHIKADGKLICNGGTATAANTIVLGEVSCGSSVGITWTGQAGNNLWSTAGNWTNNTVPSTSDHAIFNDSCLGANCNANTTSSISVRGIELQSTYPGTFTQSTGHTITTSSNGWSQAGGVFVGGTSVMTINGPFTLSGGSFSAPSNTIKVFRDFTVTGSPTFIAGTSTLEFTNTSSITITPGTVTYNDVVFPNKAACYNYDLNGGTMTVAGNLTLISSWCSSVSYMDNGNFHVSGNVLAQGKGFRGTANIVLTGNPAGQTVSSSSSTTAWIPSLVIDTGTHDVIFDTYISIYQNYIVQSVGTIHTAGSTLSFSGRGAHSIIPSDVVYHDVYFPSVTACPSWDLNEGTLHIGGTLILAVGSWCGINPPRPINNGIIKSYGDISVSSAGVSGDVLIQLVGEGDQTITGEAGASIPSIEIASGGTVHYVGTLYFRKNYIFTSGVLDAGTSTVQFVGYSSSSNYIRPGPGTYYNVTFGGARTDYDLDGSLTVMGITRIVDTDVSSGGIDNGTILSHGPVQFASRGKIGSGTIKVVGNSDQLITGEGSNTYVPNFEVQSTGGTVTYSGYFRFSGNYVYHSGTIDSSTSTARFDAGTGTWNLKSGPDPLYEVLLSGAKSSFDLNGSTLVVNGPLTLADGSNDKGSITNGDIHAYGNIGYTTYGKLGTAILTAKGSTNATYSHVGSGSRLSSELIVEKAGGASLDLITNVSLSASGQDVTVKNGSILNLNGYQLNVNDTLTVEAGGTLLCTGGSYSAGAVVNNGTITCP